MEWKISKAKIRGHSHERDFHEDNLKTYTANDLAVIAMADGCSAVTYAEEGSEIAVNTVTQLFSSLGSDHRIFSIPERELKREIIDTLRMEFVRKSGELGCTVHDLACTLLAVVSDGIEYLAINLGDGLVGRIGACDDFMTATPECVLADEKGRFSNETYYVSDIILNPDNTEAEGHLRMARGRMRVGDMLFVMTDGTVECLYSHRDNRFGRLINYFASWLKTKPYYAVNSAMKRQMIERFPKITSDDCSLALLYLESERNRPL